MTKDNGDFLSYKFPGSSDPGQLKNGAAHRKRSVVRIFWQNFP